MKNLKKMLALVLALLMVFSICACTSSNQPAEENADGGEEAGETTETLTPPKSVIIASGPSGGNWYAAGAVFAEVLSGGGTAASSEVGGGTQNIVAVGDGTADIAFVNYFGLQDAYNGVDPFTRVYDDVITLMALGTNNLYLIVPADSSITGVHDLPGKTIAVSSVGTTAYTMAMDCLKCAGIDPEKDLTLKAGSMSEGADQMKDRLVDGFLIMTGPSNATLMDIATSVDVKFLDIEKDIRDAMMAMNPGYVEYEHPAGTYKGEDNGFMTCCSKEGILVNASMSENDAYWITKTIVEGFEDIKTACAFYANITLDDMQNVGKITMHPGAKKYFDELN